MYKKLVGMLLCMLLFATAISAVGTITNKETPTVFGINTDQLKNQFIPKSINSVNRGEIFIQIPFLSEIPADVYAPVSDKDFWDGILAYENFWDVSEPICDIHWWGLGGKDLQTPGDPTGMKFNITFYEDDGKGKPGNIVCEYVDIAPTIVNTGIEYYEEPINQTFQAYYFTDVTLDPCCEMSEGWVSIQSQNYQEIGAFFAWWPSPYGDKECWQYWITENQWFFYGNDLALALTDGEPSNPDLECEGNLNWEKVIPGANVTGSFKVRNNGDAGSILNWNISSYPNDWGTNWTFTPKASVLTTDMDWLIVIVNVTAPAEENKKYTGKITVVNAVDTSDNCEIDVYLKTPRTRTTSNAILLRLFERFPNAFPILRQLLGFL